MEKRRVVITGMGTINPLGNSLEEAWASIVAQRSGIAPITLFDAADYKTRIAGEVKEFDPAARLRTPRGAAYGSHGPAGDGGDAGGAG